jgi:hypothetical protein
MPEPVLTTTELIAWLETTSTRWQNLLNTHPELLSIPCDIMGVDTVAQLLQHIVAVELRYAERLADPSRLRLRCHSLRQRRVPLRHPRPRPRHPSPASRLQYRLEPIHRVRDSCHGPCPLHTQDHPLPRPLPQHPPLCATRHPGSSARHQTRLVHGLPLYADRTCLIRLDLP